MGLGFDYNLTRPYPWRYTSAYITAVSLLVILVLTYFNVALVGFNKVATYSEEYTLPREVSWVDRMKAMKLGGFKLGCESAMLVSGATYQTPNNIFAYTIQRFYNSSNETYFSSTNYEGSLMNDCTVTQMDLFINLQFMESSLKATVNCPLPNNVQMFATASSDYKLSDIDPEFKKTLAGTNQYTSKASSAVFSVLTLAATDVNFVISKVYPSIFPDPATTPNMIIASYGLSPDMTIYNLTASSASATAYSCGDSKLKYDLLAVTEIYSNSLNAAP
ncbi:hypothetical protein BDV93DRAFT_557890 [Ceratobasidium sp. AG-I]|nr:hypothetical protein BDV93DRAFT_557890 [Ceratobasidium sp. AG-I]